MSLNKSKGQMYGFVTHTWNPLAGKCFHECSYCSTNKLKRYKVVKEKYSGEPRIDETAMRDNLGHDNFIFVCAQNDLFAPNIPKEFIDRVLSYCCLFDNQYLFQTKNPRRLQFLSFPKKSTLCCTIESNYDLDDNHALSVRERAAEFGLVSNYPKMLTIEPVMKFDIDHFLNMIETIKPFQVNIGADSGNNGLQEPSKHDVLELIDGIKKIGITVFEKDNLKRIIA